MSNKITINSIENTAKGVTMYGYIFKDDHMTESNISNEEPLEDGLQLLDFIVSTATPNEWDLLDHMIKNEKGVEINGVWYDFDEIKHILLQEDQHETI